MNDFKKLYKQPLNKRRLNFEEIFSHIKGVDYFLGDLPFPDEVGDISIENFIGFMPLPVGLVNRVPVGNELKTLLLAVEESSVVAALNKSAKEFRDQGHVKVTSLKRQITGQISYPKKDLRGCLLDYWVEIEIFLKERFFSYFERGGKVESFTKKETETFIIYELTIDPLEAMGANLITQMGETLSLFAMRWCFPKPLMSIVSNTSNEAHIRIEAETQISPEVGQRIELASRFAEEDWRRASTHNKGFMNAVDSIVVLTGNDWRAMNATLHSWGSRSGQYKPLTTWRYQSGLLKGFCELPFQLGTIGGMTKLHPVSKMALQIMRINSTYDLAASMFVAGLLQNYAALKSLVTTGIVKGHMNLHIDNIVYQATPDHAIREKLKCDLKEVLQRKKKVGPSDAEEILKNYGLSS